MENINAQEIINSLIKRWKIIVIITLVFTILAAILAFLILRPKYETEMKLFIGKESSSENSNYNNSEVVMYQNLMQTYSQLVTTDSVIEPSLKMANIPMADMEKVVKGISVVQSSTTQILDIKYESGNKATLVPVINAVTQSFIKQATKLIPGSNIQIVQNAQIPDGPSSPNKTLDIVIGFILGLIIGIIVALGMEYLDNTIKSKEELEKIMDTPVIGMIPYSDEL